MSTTPEASASDPRVIDLDAARAARAAERGEPAVVIRHGETFELPAELPVDFVDLIVADEYREAFAVLFGDAATAGRFIGPPGDLTMDDLAELADGVAGVYGIRGGLGNLPASGASSSNTSKR